MRLVTRAHALASGPIAASSLRTIGALSLRLTVQAAWLIAAGRLLGQHSYGQLAGATSLAVGMGTVANLGTNYLVVARMARSKAQGIDAWRLAWPTTLLTGVVLLVAYLSFADILLGQATLGMYIIASLGISELLIAPQLANLTSCLHGLGKVALAQLIQVVPVILRLIFIACLLSLDVSNAILIYSILHACAAASALLVGVFVTRHYLPIDMNRRLFRDGEFSQGLSFAAMAFTALNPAEIDKVIVLRGLGASPAGLYAAATRVLAAAITPVIAMLLAAQPRLFRHAEIHDSGAKHVIASIMFASLSWGALAALILYASAPLIQLAFGSRFGDLSSTIRFTCVAAIPMALRLACGGVMMSLEKPLIRAAYEIVGIGALILFMTLALPTYGIAGAGFALLASEVLMAITGLTSVVWSLRRLNQRLG